jgi:transmembrane sensor
VESEPNSIETDASRWAVRLDAGELSAAERAELDAWVRLDSRHHGALVRAQAAWLDLDRLAAMAVPGQNQSADARAWLFSRTARRAAAASVTAFIIAAGVFWHLSAPTAATYVSEIGEVRKIALTDGSGLTLNTNTHATVRFRENERDISLEHGEALFEVSHDVSRPFIVRANDVQVKAIGTAFTVRVDDARVDVLVTEGAVEVSRSGATPSIQRVSANQRVMIASSQSRLEVQPVDADDLTRQLAWREGMIAFAGEPLSIAAAEISRHTRRAIVVDDPELAARPVVGIFHANDPEQFANAAAVTFGGEVVHIDGTIYLKPRKTR